MRGEWLLWLIREAGVRANLVAEVLDYMADECGERTYLRALAKLTHMDEEDMLRICGNIAHKIREVIPYEDVARGLGLEQHTA
jgi:hypothetical protein